MVKKINKLKWTDVFSRSNLGPKIYFVIGSRSLFPFTYYNDPKSEDALNWEKVLKSIRRLELPSEESHSSSPVNADAIYCDYVFLDGGFVSREGNYFCGLKGAWIIGRKALRFVCYEMGLDQPRRWKGERSIPEYRQLV